ncbi:hypothetical protein TorRG33x02_204440 [Trema orientale]|uniref:Uncharacterized protein n=1 Tax=Trema orientale TaxID=63057 RepID=A0A2P5EE19_TREOI|nr:hypothetical protein TorRG33x02_204440 [Trema orientale]
MQILHRAQKVLHGRAIYELRTTIWAFESNWGRSNVGIRRQGEVENLTRGEMMLQIRGEELGSSNIDFAVGFFGCTRAVQARFFSCIRTVPAGFFECTAISLRSAFANRGRISPEKSRARLSNA